MSRFLAYKKFYKTGLPFITIYSTLLGIDSGKTASKRNPDDQAFDNYSNIIGYTTLGVVTGVTYPVSFPLFGCYVLYKMKK
jgi:hypothetical protein